VLLACAFVFVLPACGGGGTSLPDPHASTVPAPAPTRTSTPAPARTATPKPTPAPTSTPPPSSVNAITRIPSTAGRIGISQIFDYYKGEMPVSATYARRVDAVWASTEPRAWTAPHPGILVSQYFIMGMDRYSIMHHSLSWWQANHPDWILYACTSSGAPTHDIAYMSEIDVPDMPLDISNSSAVAYQISTMSQAARSAGYSALAIDQVVFWNIYYGGNPSFGQPHINTTEYACGTWHGKTFTRRYSSRNDPQYITDVVNYVRQARAVAHQYGITLIVSHPAGSVQNPNEQQLLLNTDIDMDETGFAIYGRYTQGNGNVFRAELAYLRYGQEHGTGMMVTDRFANESTVDRAGFEYSLATYLLSNEGGLLLFVGPVNGYGTMQYHSEYDAPIGRPCSAVAGGPSVYYRKFTGGLAVVNDSQSAQAFALPRGSYRDIEGRPVAATLSLAPNDAYVLLADTGC
jgi:hypothetical protein